MKLYSRVLVVLTACLLQIAHGQDTKLKLKVVSKLAKPYLMTSDTSGDDKKYKGFVVDVLDELAKLKNFEYELQTNDQNGYFDPDTKKWKGMIGDLVAGKADLAFADITITPQRLEAVEFTYPFKTLQLGAMHRAHEEDTAEDVAQAPPGIFSPFSFDLWVYVIVMCCAYFVALFLIGRISHKDWRLDNVKKGFKSELGLWNSFWFMASSLFLRTTHTTPRGVATRLLSICFYFFSLLVVVLYISSLTALLRVGPPPSKPFTAAHVEDLLRDKKQFATIKGGSTEAFLRTSEVGMHQKIYAAIPESNFFNNYAQAEEALEKDPNVVFIVESPPMEFITNRQCSLRGVLIPQTPRSYSIAVRPDTQYNKLISQGLVEMENVGMLGDLYDKWWVQNGGGKCSSSDHHESSDQGQSHSHQLSVSNIRDICMFFGIAIVVCVVIGLLEYCVRSVFIARSRKENLSAGIVGTLKLMCTCRDRYMASFPLQDNEIGHVDAV